MNDDGDVLAALERLRSARVLCIGDVVLELSVQGSRSSHPGGAGGAVFFVDHEERQVGGAGRVLRDLAALGAAATFVSVVGNDESGREIERLLAAEIGTEVHLLVQPDRSTPTSSRFVADERQVFRADRESATPLGPYIREDLLRLARELVATHGAVVICDQGKGAMTEGVALEVIRAAAEAGARTVVDGAGGDPIRYRGADLLTVTLAELAMTTGMLVADDGAVAAAARALIDRCALGAVLVARAGGGTMLVDAQGATHSEPGTEDAGVAIIAAALGAGLPVQTALGLAATDPRLISATP